MNKEVIRRIVLYNFRDYSDIAKINSIFEEVYPSISDSYDLKSNIDENIYVSILTDNMIYYRLLHSEDVNDTDYIEDVCYDLYVRVSNIKKSHNLDCSKLKTDDIYEFCRENYDGTSSFKHFVCSYINSNYNDFKGEMNKKRVDSIKEQIKILKRMQEYEKKLL